MADEPNSKIEDALKSYARKRREDAGAPMEIHPATRRLLQGEVARLRGGRTPQAASGGGWIRFLPRLGFALSICVVLAIVIWSVRPPAPSYEMSAAGQLEDRSAAFYDRETDAPAEPQPAGGEKVAVAIEESVVQREPAQAKNRETLYRELKDSDDKQLTELRAPAQQPAPSAPAPASVTERALNQPATPPLQQDRSAQSLTFTDENGVKKEAKPGAVMLAENETVEASEFSKALNAGRPTSNAPAYYSFGAAKPSAPLSLAPPGLSPRTTARLEEKPVALATSVTSNPAARSNRERALFFSADTSGVQAQIASGAAGASTLKHDRFYRSSGPGVLQDFQIQQTGSEVRVVDNDGSIYNGVVTAQANDAASLNSVTEQQRKTEARSRADGAREMRQQLVESHGRLAFKATGTNRTLNQIVVLDGVVAPEAENTAAGAPTRALETTANTFSNQTLRFRGKLRVGAGNEVPIEARRVAR